ncbi:MAG: neutral/alkaline non-lysosomal ceramidase N-terminal domain-containing protein [Nitrospirae bacterium]|nr:neutral/alkaline non-lysosomal ceramidase N-terminal domain-containing protein [Nitrospirota bacterium]
MSRTKHLLSLLCAVIALPLVTGCLSIDYTPLDQQPFFHKTEQALNALALKAPDESSPGPLRIGTAKVDITPPIGLPLAGYGARTSTGIHDPILARALAVSNGQNTVVLVSLDLLAITDDLFDSVLRKVRADVPLPEDHLLITATHTHSGPGNIGKRFWETLAAGPYNDAVFERTTDGTARAVIEAYRHLRPATMAYGRVDAGEFILNRMIRGGPIDPDLSFLAFKTPEGRPIAYLVNFSAHPTLLRSTNRLLSGDFPAVVSRILEESQAPDEIVALYISGAVADQRAHPPNGKNVFERAERMGRELAERILTAESRRPVQNNLEVSSDRIPLELPPPQIKMNASHRLPIWMGRALLDRSSSIQVVRIGRTLFLAVPCDLGSEIGMSLKHYAGVKGFDAIVAGFANDYIGYVISGKYYSSPVYEAFMSFNGPYMGDYLTFAIEKMINRIKPEQDDANR